MELNIRDKKEQRKFGLVMCVAISILGLIRWAIHGFGPVPWGFFSVAAVFGVLGLLAPKVLQPIFWAWMKFSIGINWVMTRILLTISFITLIVPVRFIFLIKGDDPLKRKWDPDRESYWEEPEDQPEQFDRYLDQF